MADENRNSNSTSPPPPPPPPPPRYIHEGFTRDEEVKVPTRKD